MKNNDQFFLIEKCIGHIDVLLWCLEHILSTSKRIEGSKELVDQIEGANARLSLARNELLIKREAYL